MLTNLEQSILKSILNNEESVKIIPSDTYMKLKRYLICKEDYRGVVKLEKQKEKIVEETLDSLLCESLAKLD